ncbi:PREDICTED: protein LURP-one-related 11-like [Nelumbo nucifera]|uniref:Protein LURP-one-related 11-like n=1 Tax=Nelumbo nucifera TaxID=4432 RepID=A0A1U8A2P0_NELNU|nr:PREDICTED: protein LURP-one-related 11-like [Nelumbo nucifera]
MAKVYPGSSSSSSSSNLTSKREAFTIWMKSLVLHGSGCTVFDSKGEILYRVDNYNTKGNNQVYLMDRRGHVLFLIHRKKGRVFGVGCWEGYKCDADGTEEISMKNPCFQVRKFCRILKPNPSYKVTLGLGCDHQNPSAFYSIDGLVGKSAYKIVEESGKLVAEVKQKQSSSGVVLGEDVLALVVEPHVDHSLVMGIVVVYGLINHQI